MLFRKVANGSVVGNDHPFNFEYSILFLLAGMKRHCG